MALPILYQRGSNLRLVDRVLFYSNHEERVTLNDLYRRWQVDVFYLDNYELHPVHIQALLDAPHRVKADATERGSLIIPNS